MSELWNKKHQSQVVSEYITAVRDAEQNTVKVALYEANRYNKSIVGKQGSLRLSELQYDDYSKQLCIDGTDVIAYVEIPSINVQLPVYSGIDAETLQDGVGHLPGTSLPIGGKSTHCVLSAHTGLPGQELFTNLDDVVVGNEVVLYALNETLRYLVFDIEVIEPEILQPLFIQEGKDLLTLVTCTPYGVNTHRLLVHCKRVTNDIDVNATFVEDTGAYWWILFLVAVSISIVVIFITVYRRYR